LRKDVHLHQQLFEVLFLMLELLEDFLAVDGLFLSTCKLRPIENHEMGR
jgi:hypothetical protein